MSGDKRQRFIDVFNGVRDELVQHFASENMPADAQDWFRRNLDWNTPGGKLNRGLSVVDTVEIIKGSALTDEEYKKAAILGWMVELLQAFFLVSDDIMDQSITRRGQPCWYRVEGVGNIAINDAFLLEGAIYHLLKKYFRSEPYYVNLMELFHETSYQTEMGQLVDLITAPEDSVDLSKFSLEKHKFIVIYKTAFYSFYLPVALAMYMSGIKDTSSYDLAKEILIPLGEYFQVQDDYLDCFGSPADIGKIGTDIIDNKCSWLINVALQVATPAQRKVLDENYGRKDAACEARIKALYEELDLRQRYATYEQQSYDRVMGLINTIPPEGRKGAQDQAVLKREVFKSFLDKIYKRKK